MSREPCKSVDTGVLLSVENINAIAHPMKTSALTTIPAAGYDTLMNGHKKQKILATRQMIAVAVNHGRSQAYCADKLNTATPQVTARPSNPQHVFAHTPLTLDQIDQEWQRRNPL
jgi:hypothetical protein